jgi:hypothetical protein
MNIAILVMGADGKYKDHVPAIKETWGKEEHPDVNMFYYFANGEGATNSDLVVNCNTGMYDMLEKTWLAFKAIPIDSFDYIMKVCCGSYIDQDLLVKYLEDKPRKGLYAGISGEYNGAKYVSGSGFILSKDVAHSFLSLKPHAYNDGIEDVSVGRMLNDRGIFPSGIGDRVTYDVLTSKIQIHKDGQDRIGLYYKGTPPVGFYHYHFREPSSALYYIHSVVRGKRDIQD